jgi:hemin uptake protein HemP
MSPSQHNPSTPHAGQRQSPSAATAPSVDSTELLQGCKMVQIVHNGTVYRLQVTQQGKLILTK